jgi:hypothetical protein
LLQIPSAIRFWIDVLSLVAGVLSVLGALAIYLFRASVVTHPALANALAPISKALLQDDRRLAKLEGDIDRLPDADDWSEMRDRMTRLEGGIENIGTRVEAIGETMERIERPLNVLIDGKLKAGS